MLCTEKRCKCIKVFYMYFQLYMYVICIKRTLPSMKFSSKNFAEEVWHLFSPYNLSQNHRNLRNESYFNFLLKLCNCFLSLSLSKKAAFGKNAMQNANCITLNNRVMIWRNFGNVHVKYKTSRPCTSESFSYISI